MVFRAVPTMRDFEEAGERRWDSDAGAGAGASSGAINMGFEVRA